MEFGELGYEGASTLSIARRADAHQPQINYHFSSKEELWRAAVDRLFADLDESAPDVTPGDDLAATFAMWIRHTVESFAARPQLNQIMAKEATAPSERLTWIVERHVQSKYDTVRRVWAELQAQGVAAPIDAELAHYVIVGAASLPFVHAAEANLLLDGDPFEPERVERHIDGLIATLLPGLDLDH